MVCRTRRIFQPYRFASPLSSAQPVRFDEIPYLYLKIDLVKSEYKYVYKEEKLDFGNVYHVYNKAIGNDLLFRKEDDYYFFSKKLERYINQVAEIYSYCLLPNHFHFLIKTKQEDEMPDILKKKSSEDERNPFHQTFSNFFNSYSKSYNKAHNRAGRLFLYPFKRILVDQEDYLLCLINYIHRNPIHHGIVKDFFDWKHSSYNAILSGKSTKIERNYILHLFGSINDFIVFHEQNKTKPGIDKYYLE